MQMVEMCVNYVTQDVKLAQAHTQIIVSHATLEVFSFCIITSACQVARVEQQQMLQTSVWQLIVTLLA
jgi:hypothetical protein